MCDNIIGTLLDILGRIKDGFKTKLDLVSMSICKELKPIKKKERKRIYLPLACYTLSTKENDALWHCLESVKVSNDYSSNIRNFMSLVNHKLYNLKSHDSHTLMQQLLLIAIRSILQNVSSLI